MSEDPTNSVIALKDDSLPDQRPITQAQHTKRLRKGCNKNFFSTYSTKYTEDTEALGRPLSQARSKPDPVDRVQTAHWLRGTVVERRSSAGELSLSCARPVADG